MKDKYITWNEDKNRLLQKMRDISFEDVLVAIEQWWILDDVLHPDQDKYPNQRVLIIQIYEYVYNIPYIEDDEKIFLKTIFPSRKSKKLYLK